MSIGKQLIVLLVIAAILGGIAAVVVSMNKPDILGPVPGDTTTVTTVQTEGMEIFIGEDAVVLPEIGPNDTLGVIMVNETREGKDPLTRCQEMGGGLTLDMICHHVTDPIYVK